MHKSFKGPAGHIDYVTDNDGYYSYCIKQMKATDGKVSRIRIRINFGFDSEHYESLIKDHNFDAVNLQVHKLNDMLTMTLNEADYQKHKEVEYHSHTEKMNNAALWWPVFQVSYYYLGHCIVNHSEVC